MVIEDAVLEICTPPEGDVEVELPRGIERYNFPGWKRFLMRYLYPHGPSSLIHVFEGEFLMTHDALPCGCECHIDWDEYVEWVRNGGGSSEARGDGMGPPNVRQWADSQPDWPDWSDEEEPQGTINPFTGRPLADPTEVDLDFSAEVGAPQVNWRGEHECTHSGFGGRELTGS